MNRVRIALLVAGAALAGLPAVATAQDQPQGNRGERRWNGGDGQGGERGFERGDRSGNAPRGEVPTGSPVAQPAQNVDRGPQGGGQPAQGSYAERRLRDADRRYRDPNQPAPAAQVPSPPPSPMGAQPGRFAGGQPDAQGWRNNDDRRRDFNPGNRNDGVNGAYGGRYDGANRGYGGDPRADRRFDTRPGFADRRYDDRRVDTRGWRNDRRYDWRGYRDGNRQLFRAPRYAAPRGYGFGYRTFSIGFRLDPFLYDRSYWIDDPYAYRLPPVDGPYRWVRYYNDVLLVDIATGQVADVIRDFFW